MLRRRRAALTMLAGFGAAALAASGCGSDHPNEPRPAAPISITAEIDDDKVSVSPSRFGAGQVVFSISNVAAGAAPLVVEGEDGVAKTSEDVTPDGTGDLKVNLEPGDYTVTAGDESEAKPARLRVGSERPSAQDELLLP